MFVGVFDDFCVCYVICVCGIINVFVGSIVSIDSGVCGVSVQLVFSLIPAFHCFDVVGVHLCFRCFQCFQCVSVFSGFAMYQCLAVFSLLRCFQCASVFSMISVVPVVFGDSCGFRCFRCFLCFR